MSHDRNCTVLWKPLIRKNLGKQVVRKSDSLRLDILAVDLCIKPAYLYDVGLPDPECITNFLCDLQTSGLIQNNLNVLQIGMDSLVVNVAGLMEQWTHVMAERDQLVDRLIDITEAEPGVPCVCSDNNIAMQLVEAFQWVVEHMNGTRIQMFEMPSSIDCNVSSLFGLLLSYPALYWYKADSSQGNCLSMESLDCVSVTVRITGDYTRDRDKDVASHDHLLFSFSYPSCLRGNFKQSVRQWYDRIEKKVANADLFHETRLLIQEKVFEIVNL